MSEDTSSSNDSEGRSWLERLSQILHTDPQDRQDLLGHRSGRITTHYSAAELGGLIEAANRVCGEKSRKSPALVVLRRA